MRIYCCCLLLSLFLWSCSSKNKLTHEETCHQKFVKLDEKYQKGRYSAISEPLSDFLSTCNGTPFTEKAQFQLAQAHYHLKEWIEAAAEYRNFVQIYPNSPEAEIAHYRLAVSFSNQIYSVDRDQNNTHKSIEEFQNYVRLFPESPRTDSAKSKIVDLKRILGKKEIKIGKLYLKLSEPQAAAIYFKSALEKYTGQIDTKAVRLYLVECYLRLNQIAEAQKYFDEIGELKTSSPHYSKSKGLKKKLEEKRSLMDKSRPAKETGQEKPEKNS